MGDLGGHVLEILARVPNIPKIVTADIRADWGVRKTNSARIGAAQIGIYPDIEFRSIDVFDSDKTSEVLNEIKPAIICKGIDLEAAVDINHRAQVYDGIASIEADGSVVLTDESVAIFKKFLDYDCACYRVEECEAKAQELDEKYKRWASRFSA